MDKRAAKAAKLRAELQRLGLPARTFEDDLIRAYVDASEQFETASAKLAQATYLAKGPGGSVVLSPLVEVRDRAVATIDRLGTILGLSANNRIAPATATWAEFAAALIDSDVHE